MNLEPMPLVSLAAVRSGGGAPQEAAAFGTSGLAFVRAGSLPKLLDGADEDSLEKIAAEVADQYGLKVFPAGTVLFAKSGMSATKGYVYRLRGPAYVVNHLAALVPHAFEDAPFLERALQRFSPTALIRDPAYPSIRLGEIESMKVLAPRDSGERRRIAELLDKADALRVKRRGAIAQLDIITQSIFLDMFGDPTTNPRGWAQKCAGSLGTVTTGNTPPREDLKNYGDAIEWIKSDNLNTSDYYATRASEGLSEVGMTRARIVSAGAILVTCIAGSPSSIGNAAMVNRPVAFNQQINAFVPEGGDPLFFFAQLAVGKRLVQQASTGGMKGMVSKRRFEKILLMEPPRGLQDRFCKLASRIEGMKSGLHASLAHMETLFASLQARAFRGEL